MRSRYGRRAFRASPIRCVGERIKATGVPEFREVAWRACAFNRFRAVNFYRDSAQFESRSQEQFLLNWKSELQATPPASINGFYIVVARAGGSTAETAANLALAEKQGLQLQELMGINSSQVVAVTNNPEVPFPVACRTFTLLVIPSVNTPRFTTATEITVFSDSGAASGNSIDNNTADPQPTLSRDLARAIRFDANNEVIRDERFNSVLKNATESASKIKTLELVSIDDSTDEIAETRAKALLKVLKDEGVANKTAKVVVRKADAAESTEIIRSGFLLNRSIVLR